MIGDTLLPGPKGRLPKNRETWAAAVILLPAKTPLEWGGRINYSVGVLNEVACKTTTLAP